MSVDNDNMYFQNGNTGCGFFKWGIQDYKDFCLRINIGIQRKLMNFEFWINGELSKSAKLFLSLKNTNLGTHFLLLTFFDS